MIAKVLYIGQKNHVNVYRFVLKDTIKKSILGRAKCIDTAGKSILQKNLKNLKFLDNFSHEELFALYQYLRKN